MILVTVVNLSRLKGIDDTTLKGRTLTFSFTTGIFNLDSLSQFSSYIRSFRITNKDSVNELEYRFDEVRAELISIPIATDDRQEGWTSLIQIIPDAVSGTGQIEVELIDRTIAELSV